MIRPARSTRMYGSIVLLYVILSLGNAAAQTPPPSEIIQTLIFPSPIQPEYKDSKNLAILERFSVNTYTDRFEYFSFDNKNYIVAKEGLTNDTAGFVFYDATDPAQAFRVGRINLLSNYLASDMEVVSYHDTIRLFLYAPRKDSTVSMNLFLDVRIATILIDALSTSPNIIDSLDYSNYGITVRHDNPSWTTHEMIYYHDGMLLFATNTNYLRYVDVSTPSTWDTHSDIVLYPNTSITLHPQVKIHEVKALTRQDGKKVVGLGAVRGGMRLLTFNQNWGLLSIVTQYYDHDRTFLPNTIINPNKVMFDPTVHYPLTDERNNKWDYRMCHSVLPYDQNDRRYVLTVDEHTTSASGQDSAGNWIPEIWEGLDFYEPNAVDDLTKQSYPVYYSGVPVLMPNGAPLERNGWSGFTEVDTLRLNFNHRNHPKHRGVDPLRIQGAFLRIWDRDSLGINDLQANQHKLLFNAYDVQESETHPEGLIGLENIPEVADVPTGLHEPYLVGNTLYLAGYNTGPRILRLNGHEIAVRAYCRTESFLSNDLNSVNFYNRPDILMYAKGIYRLVPDTNRPGIVYGSDLYNGMWIFRFYDSTLTDTLKHIAFQESIRIGTVEADKPLRFKIGAGGAVIADTAKVEFLDNTGFAWETEDSLVVNGELNIGAVSFDTTHYAAPRNKIYCGSGGTVYLGGMEKVITGRLNIHVAAGGRLVVLNGTTLQLLDSSNFLVEGDLTLESCTLSDGCHFIARGQGVITIDTAAEVSGLKDVLIADRQAVLKFSDSCVVRMQRGGGIICRGIAQTPVSGAGGAVWCRIQSMYAQTNRRCQAGDEWNGLLLYGNWSGTAIRNMFIHHGDPGLWTYSGNPIIEDCEISYNRVGFRITEGNPVVRHNRISENLFLGLDVQNHDYPELSSNRICHNINYGLHLYGGNDVWYDNRIDSNMTGVEVIEFSKVYFNKWDGSFPPAMCDTSRGNGIRYNWSGGVIVREYNRAEFHCDNSVYRNSVNWGATYDLGIQSCARIIGWGNYPDSIPGVSPDTLRFSLSYNGIFQWADPTDSIPTPGSDPVLLKTLSASTFSAAMARANRNTQQGFYAAAQADYAFAAQEASTIQEALQSLIDWREMVAIAERDSIVVQPTYKSPYWHVLENGLSGLSAYSDSSWKRNMASELLSIEQIRKRDTTDAQARLTSIISHSGSASCVRRSLLRLVYLQYCIKSNYSAAYSYYEALNNAYPRTYENVYAKILLGLAPDSADWAAIAKQSGEEDLGNTDAQPHAPLWLQIEGPWPNPLYGIANLRVHVEEQIVTDHYLYDMKGSRLRSVHSLQLNAGWNDVVIDCTGLSSGAYMLVFQRGARRQSVRLNVIGRD